MSGKQLTYKGYSLRPERLGGGGTTVRMTARDEVEAVRIAKAQKLIRKDDRREARAAAKRRSVTLPRLTFLEKAVD